jgi:hypothetical protein
MGANPNANRTTANTSRISSIAITAFPIVVVDN